MAQIATTVEKLMNSIVERLRHEIDMIERESIFYNSRHMIGEAAIVDEFALTVAVGRKFHFDLANFVGAGIADLEMELPFEIGLHAVNQQADEAGHEDLFFDPCFSGCNDAWRLWRMQLKAIAGWIAEDEDGDTLTVEAIEPQGGEIEVSDEGYILTAYKATIDISFNDIALASETDIDALSNDCEC